jgi:FdhD protein
VRVVERDVHRSDGGPTTDRVAIEEPLEIRVDGASVAVTMRTPGDDLDLAAGFLFTEGIVDGADDLAALAHVGDPSGPANVVDALLAAGVDAHLALGRATRALYASSSCGICGKASIDRIHAHAPPIEAALDLAEAQLFELPDRLRAAQLAFGLTGGLHAAALVTPDGDLEVVREDVGRHNAVDKVLGARLRADRVPVGDRALLVSSRAGFEIVQKALVARVPLVVALGAASSLAIDLARASGMGLIGFLTPSRFTRYA